MFMGIKKTPGGVSESFGFALIIFLFYVTIIFIRVGNPATLDNCNYLH